MISKTFIENAAWNLKQVSVLVRHAEKVRGRARSGYYKSAIILLSTIAEALAYKILDESNLKMPFENWQCEHSIFLLERYKGDDGKRLSICERSKQRFKLTKQTEFIKVNRVCFNLGIFSKPLFNKIERVRELRNKIHIQGLDNLDRSYTKRELGFVSSVTYELLDKLLGKLKSN